MLRIGVVGGAGFIGWHFVNLLFQKGLSCTVLDNFSNPAVKQTELEQLGARVVHFDIMNQDADFDMFNELDLVVNFAAETHNDDSLVRPRDFLNANLVGTFNLLEACRKRNVRFHQVSTDEVFGDTPVDSLERFNLESAYRPSSPYSASKAGADMLTMAWGRSFDLEVTISYCTNNVGTHQSMEKLVPRTSKLISLGKPPIIYGDGNNIRDWIDVRDHVEGVFACITKGKPGGRYFFEASNAYSSKEIVNKLIDISGKRLKPNYVEDRPGHDRRYSLDSSSTRLELGWEPKHSLLDTLGEAYGFYAAKTEPVFFSSEGVSIREWNTR